MTPALLREAGEVLYGPRWQSELARALGVTDRTVRRWDAGEFSIPPEVVDQLRRLLMVQQQAAGRVLKKLNQKALGNALKRFRRS